MAKVINQILPAQDVLYRGPDGQDMYLGDTYRGVLTEGYYVVPVGDMAIVKKSSRQKRQRSLGRGTPQQRNLRKVFKACTELWRTLPEDCAGYCGCDPLTTKKSVFEAKDQFGIICSYYDLWMKCCLDESLSKIPDWRWGSKLQDKSLYLPLTGECFPDNCIAEIASTISYETALMELNSYQTVELADEYPGACYTWQIWPPGVGTFIPAYKKYWSPAIAPDPPTCVTITVFLSQYECARLLDQIEICFEVCNDDGVEYSDTWSADTIARNGTATVTVLNPSGLGGPFNWSVSGTGFSMGAAQTESGVNTLYAGPTACGTATIYISTCTGRVIQGYMRCITGRWVAQPRTTVWPYEPVVTGTIRGKYYICDGSVPQCYYLSSYSFEPDMIAKCTAALNNGITAALACCGNSSSKACTQAIIYTPPALMTGGSWPAYYKPCVAYQNSYHCEVEGRSNDYFIYIWEC